MLITRFTQEYLQSIFSYNPESGIAKWITRPRTDFRYAKDHKTWLRKHVGNQITALNPSNGKITVNLFQRAWNLDQLIYIWVTNEEPPPIYHINGCNADNRWNNLTTTPQKTTRYAGGDLQVQLTPYNTYSVSSPHHTFGFFEDKREAKTFMLELCEKLQVGWSDA